MLWILSVEDTQQLSRNSKSINVRYEISLKSNKSNRNLTFSSNFDADHVAADSDPRIPIIGLSKMEKYKGKYDKRFFVGNERMNAQHAQLLGLKEMYDRKPNQVRHQAFQAVSLTFKPPFLEMVFHRRSCCTWVILSVLFKIR